MRLHRCFIGLRARFGAEGTRYNFLAIGPYIFCFEFHWFKLEINGAITMICGNARYMPALMHHPVPSIFIILIGQIPGWRCYWGDLVLFQSRCFYNNKNRLNCFDSMLYKKYVWLFQTLSEISNAISFVTHFSRRWIAFQLIFFSLASLSPY